MKGSEMLRLRDEHQKALVKIFNEQLISGRHSKWTVWADFVTLTACSLSIVDVERREARDKLYANTAKKYKEQELLRFAKMLSELIEAYEENPAQDLLGELYMRLEMGNEHRGQIFTPYTICELMAKLTAGDNLKEEIEKRGYISVNDPCCGAGALLIAFANEAKEQGINYQQRIEFVAQDIDFTAAMMCYIQLSLLGCAGYVIVGNTLTTPPDEPLSNQAVWYTPLYFLKSWHMRRMAKRLKMMCSIERPVNPAKLPEPAKLPGKEIVFTEGPGGQLSFF